MPPSAAWAPAARPNAARTIRISFFIVVAPSSVGCEGNAVRHRLERAEAAPPRHQQEEAEVVDRADLRQQGLAFGGRLDAQVAEDEEEGDEDAVHPLVPARTVADRAHRALVQPGQE